MSLKQNNSALERDDLDEGGLLVVPPTKDTKMYRVREVVDYCKKRGLNQTSSLMKSSGSLR